MKNLRKTAALPLLLFTLIVQTSAAFAQPATFTYQGRLNDTNGAVTGSVSLNFRIYDSAGAISPIWMETFASVAVSNGLFTVTLGNASPLDGVFDGAARYLGIQVGTAAELTPRQPITSTPYAITAANVASGGLAAGTYSSPLVLDNPDNNLAGTFTGNGANVTNVNAISLGGISSAGFWKTNGNAGAGGAFLGTTDNQPVEFKVNSQRALRLEPNASSAPNVIGGASVNHVSAGTVGAVIVGGGAVNYFGNAFSNRVSADFSAIVGGEENRIESSAIRSFIGGGRQNSIQNNAYESTIAGGIQNAIQPDANNSVIAGGWNNTIQSGAARAAIGGGGVNTIHASANDAVIAGGYDNHVQTNADFSMVGGGNGNAVQSSADYAGILGGYFNIVQSDADFSALGGGFGNEATGSYATVPGGDYNRAALNAFAAGHRAKADHAGTFVWADSTEADFTSSAAKQFLIRAAGGVGIGTTNPPPGGLQVASGGLAVTGASSPNYNGAKGVFVEGLSAFGAVFAFDYNTFTPQPLCLNTPGGNVGIGTTIPAYKLDVAGSCAATTFVTTSDRNVKENIRPVDATDVLAKVVALPISQWNFKSDTVSEHLGPMAQDFRAAFGLGLDDKHIATVDADGVAFAAIQGLNQKLEEQKSENAELKRQLAELKVLVQQLAEKK